jgi:hypothetical protein
MCDGVRDGRRLSHMYILPGGSAHGVEGHVTSSRAAARRGTLSLVVLLVGFVVGGCQLLLGDYTTLEDGHRCGLGAVRCVGNVLQTCNSRRTAWDNAAVCASETLCDETHGVCVPPTCAADERHCQDADLQICKATRDGWALLRLCDSAGLCSTERGDCTDKPCEPGEIQCNGNVVQACRSDRSGWDDLFACASAALCNRAQGKCDEAACKPGDFHCEGAELETCNAMLDGWDTAKICASEALCDPVTGSCGTANCSIPGLFRCTEEGGLEQCDDNLTGWLPVQSCTSAAHCSAVSGACTDDACMPGARQCNGATLEVCNAARTAWDPKATCESDGLCQQTLAAGSAGCVPPVCKPNDTRCAGVQPQICNASRTDFRDNGTPCVTVELCNAGSGTCGTPVCEPNQTRCTGAQPEICNAGQTDFVADGPACPSEPLCNRDTGTCGDQKCKAGQLRCDPDNPTHLQRCKDDLTDWEATPCDICTTAELCTASLGATTCDATSCKDPVCTAGTPSCGGTGSDQGKVLQVCNAGRTGYTPCQTCVTGELCTASLKTPFSCTSTACTAPSCSPSDRWCAGTGNLVYYQCPPSRINTMATVLDTCATSELCALTHQNNGTECVEPSCNLSDRWCGGSGNRTLYQCPPSRINTEATQLDTCATNGLCELTRQKNETTCEAGCAVNATQCAGTGTRTLQMCKSDRTGFQDCDTCTSAALCTDSLGATTCNSSACHACLAGDAQCNAAGNYETCNAAHTGFSVTDCLGNGCDAASGGCLLAAGGAGGT